MKIGMIIGVERELKAFLEGGMEITEEKVGTTTLYRTEMYGHEVYAALSGYGEIDAAARTQLLITVTGCELVLNFGVVGALVPELKVEDLFVVEKVCHYDYDVSPIDPVVKHQYEEYPDEFIPVDEKIRKWVLEKRPELRPVAVASGDRFVADRADKEALAALGCQICDMEIAAIARICLKNEVPCLSIKCISDTMDGDGADYNANVTRSAAKAFEVIRELLETM
uniref:5'-Methylthioadenosine/S-adenosylhomocysteine nucleosidase n=1 Tax=uncultured bacterium Contig178 TaxID=1393517 RepID=W0FP83_9BACT|nr:5'-Methylthioadenosine/S-adenosylhomocysteine nucleosidase [uncultured bacterium Contig178]